MNPLSGETVATRASVPREIVSWQGSAWSRAHGTQRRSARNYTTRADSASIISLLHSAPPKPARIRCRCSCNGVGSLGLFGVDDSYRDVSAVNVGDRLCLCTFVAFHIIVTSALLFVMTCKPRNLILSRIRRANISFRNRYMGKSTWPPFFPQSSTIRIRHVFCDPARHFHVARGSKRAHRSTSSETVNNNV